MKLGARKPDQGVACLIAGARALARRHDFAIAQGFFLIRLRLARAVHLRAKHGSGHAPEPKFICDVGLGGVARWLRAAGYDAGWRPDIDDAALIRWARQEQAILLTTDSLMFGRKVLRDGEQPALWLPPGLNVDLQITLVFAEFGLVPRPSRCMACGGVLQSVDKEAVWERIPPKTRRWRDAYFRCVRCDRIFWHGTHWRRIQDRFQQLGDRITGWTG